MNDYPVVQKLVPCPYDSKHRIVEFRLHRHIQKCKKNHPTANLVTCMYNSLHLLKPEDMVSHLSECPDSVRLEASLYSNKPKEVPYMPPPELEEHDPDFMNYVSDYIKNRNESPVVEFNVKKNSKKKEISHKDLVECYERVLKESELRPLPKPKSKLVCDPKPAQTVHPEEGKSSQQAAMTKQDSSFEKSHLLPDVSDMNEELEMPKLPTKDRWNKWLDSHNSLQEVVSTDEEFSSSSTSLPFSLSTSVCSTSSSLLSSPSAVLPQKLQTSDEASVGRGHGKLNQQTQELKTEQVGGWDSSVEDKPYFPIVIASRGRCKR